MKRRKRVLHTWCQRFTAALKMSSRGQAPWGDKIMTLLYSQWSKQNQFLSQNLEEGRKNAGRGIPGLCPFIYSLGNVDVSPAWVGPWECRSGQVETTPSLTECIASWGRQITQIAARWTIKSALRDTNSRPRVLSWPFKQAGRPFQIC